MSVCDPQQVQTMQDDVNLFGLTLMTVFSSAEKETFQAQHEVTSMLIKSNCDLYFVFQCFPQTDVPEHHFIKFNGCIFHKQSLKRTGYK